MGNWGNAEAIATMIHTAQLVSNAFCATQTKRCLDVCKAVTATLAANPTAMKIQVRSAMRFARLRFGFPVLCEYEYGVACTSHR